MSNDWSIKGFTIKPREVIGQGSYGVVYRAFDSAGNKIAAKRIDLAGHSLPNIVRDIEKLKQLDHPNIVKVYDIHQEENLVWMFMELCDHGDLYKFYRKREFTLKQLFEIMVQIAEGIEYLHQNNVVHQDIKPGNILVSRESPIQIKVTDFDVSKFFEEVFNTSAMSTNVGTLAFKAPEFFQRTQQGKLVYHRNVDCYAMGLTFLALLQGNPGRTLLIPRIETPREDSELHAPSVGQLIAERMKYNIKELRVINTDNMESKVATSPRTNEAKLLIAKMTRVNPKERISAAHVSKGLVDIRKVC